MPGFRRVPFIVLVTILVSLSGLRGQSLGEEGAIAAPKASVVVPSSGPGSPSSATDLRPPLSPSAAETGPPVSAPSGPPLAEGGEDVVLSPGDVESRVTSRPEEGESIGDLPDEFFVNAIDEIEKGKAGQHAGLMDRIEKNVRYFQNKGRDRFELWLSRSGKYSNLMREILEDYGLPGDLIYLALIESGFSPKAYSVAQAAGPWQFIRGTASRYGLRVDWWIDERRDFEKSTRAAATYLRELYGMFDSWPLAAAAYNAGEGKIMRAVARYKTDDIAKLIRHRYLKHETKDYVPKMLAAMSIAKEPEKYGFVGIRYEDPFEFDKAVVPGGTDLCALERVLGLPDDALKEYNPELRRFCTPPTVDAYQIRLPRGYASIASERMAEILSDAKVTFLLHQVRKGETLDSIASKYDTPVSVLKEINGLKRNVLAKNARLIIPVTGLSDDEAAPGKTVSPAQLTMAHLRVEEGKVRRVRSRSGQRTILVRRGDSLSRIARETGVSPAALAKANGLRAGSGLKAGTRLKIPRGAARGSGKSSEASAGHVGKGRSGV